MACALDGHIGEYIVKEPKGSFQQVPSELFGEYFSKVLTMCLMGKVGAN